MKKTLYITLCFSIGLFFSSCKSEETNSMPEEEKTEELLADDSQIEEESENETKEENQIQTTTTADAETRENIKRIEEKYGEQWDFCTCVVKMDSINTALMEASDEIFDLVMERSDYIDNKCKEVLIQPNNTPEERSKHQQRVRECLKNQ